MAISYELLVGTAACFVDFHDFPVVFEQKSQPPQCKSLNPLTQSRLDASLQPRNSKCNCGSGVKFKLCCMRKDGAK